MIRIPCGADSHKCHWEDMYFIINGFIKKINMMVTYQDVKMIYYGSESHKMLPMIIICKVGFQENPGKIRQRVTAEGGAQMSAIWK